MSERGERNHSQPRSGKRKERGREMCEIVFVKSEDATREKVEGKVKDSR